MDAPRLPARALVGTVLRGFTVQGSWNYRTMVGNGMAFSLLPVLRHIHEKEDALEEALGRHCEHFNAHPYLTTVGTGAVTRLENDGEDPETIRRFKAAIRGPLGGLGDALVWAAWLPVSLLVSLVLTWGGLGPAGVVLLFLLLYNAGHLGLRVWGFRVGLREGRGVGRALRRARLGGKADGLTRIGSFLTTFLAGIVLVQETTGGPGPVPWVPLACAAFLVGAVGGHRVWRPAALAVVATILLLLFIPLHT